VHDISCFDFGNCNLFNNRQLTIPLKRYFDWFIFLDYLLIFKCFSLKNVQLMNVCNVYLTYFFEEIGEVKSSSKIITQREQAKTSKPHVMY